MANVATPLRLAFKACHCSHFVGLSPLRNESSWSRSTLTTYPIRRVERTLFGHPAAERSQIFRYGTKRCCVPFGHATFDFSHEFVFFPRITQDGSSAAFSVGLPACLFNGRPRTGTMEFSGYHYAFLHLSFTHTMDWL